ncbi:putative transcriptional regulator [Candidatus Regiella insecticola 5.15]|uniref:Repressor protein C n=2 Tax=Candidatus Regiella insecticola TaxID=138073 RepID=A0A6L2ZLH3_9ENTR|nr:helix-turn-helix domain-containing protein [Candidatus Regiella insecticola]EGY28153.1 putative transcriptional regulator [Candidatus Regiella insecticola 5.15]GFN45697.1 repressor protein C [Candidatus Regiella insecticola]
MTLSEKIKAIRKSEGLSKAKFCEFTNIPLSTLDKYEMGKFEPSGATLMKITQHPLFIKYTLWLMTGNAAPEAGQISPALSPGGHENIFNHLKDQKAG